MTEWAPRAPLSWTLLPALAKEDLVQWHKAYLGLYRFEETHERLHKAFYNDNDAYGPRSPGCGACIGMVMDQGGKLVPGPAALSSALRAVGQAVDQPRSGEKINITLDQMEKFMASQERLCREFGTAEDRRRQVARTQEPPAQGPESFEDLTKTARRVCGISKLPDLATSGILIKSVQVSDRNEQELEFLSSFLLEDPGGV